MRNKQRYISTTSPEEGVNNVANKDSTPPTTNNTTPTSSNTPPTLGITLNMTASMTGPAAEAKSIAQDKDEWQALANGVVKPGRRRNKNLSGRAGRRQFHSLQTIRKVGGYAMDLEAIYAPADAELCVVRECTTTCDNPEHRHTYTRSVGGNTSGQNYIGGRG